MSIEDDIRALDADAMVEFFELDMTPIGGDVQRFHAGTNELLGPVVWQGNSYDCWPVEAQDFEWTGSGKQPRPKLTIANITGLISGYVLAYQDMLGTKVTRKRTLVKYLDAVNFPGGVNASADPNQYMPDEIYYIDQKESETKLAVQFVLATEFDLTNAFVPARQIIQNICPWKYKGADCGWAPDPVNGPFYDANGNATNAAGDVCSKHEVTGCKVRFGATSELPFGGFPAATLTKI